MYSDKEVAAMIRLYNSQEGDLTPEKFIESVVREDGWDHDENQPAVFRADEDMKHDSYLVKIEMMLPVSTENIGDYADTETVIKEFKKSQPFFADLVGDNGEKLFIFKCGDIEGKAYTGGKVKEKAPVLSEPNFKEGKEIQRREIVVKKLTFDNNTWHALTYDITSGSLNEEFNISDCLDTLLSAVISVIRSSEHEAKLMKRAIEFLNELYIDPTAGVINLSIKDLDNEKNHPFNQEKNEDKG